MYMFTFLLLKEKDIYEIQSNLNRILTSSARKFSVGPLNDILGLFANCLTMVANLPETNKIRNENVRMAQIVRTKLILIVYIRNNTWTNGYYFPFWKIHSSK